jgi:hypothetical protein
MRMAEKQMCSTVATSQQSKPVSQVEEEERQRQQLPPEKKAPVLTIPETLQ